MNRLPLLASFVAGVYGIAEPSCTTVKCVFDDPTVTPSITAYPTTLTFTSHMSMTTQVYNFAVGGGSDGGVTTDIQNMVTVEPHASSPTAFPATVVMTAVTSHTMVTGNPPSIPVGTATVSLETQLSTWIVRPPTSTDIPRHETGICGNCTQPAAWKPDPQCEAKNQTTGCVRQCQQRDNLWYCFQKDDWYQENVMGRVCWWKNPFYGTTEYKMLGEPCVTGDRRVDCAACETYG